jgi:hypothetical protein
MALVDIPALWIPAPEAYPTAYGVRLLDATTDRFAWIFAAPKAGNLQKIGFLTGSVPALNASSTLVFSLQDVTTTTGFPDDTDDQSVTIPNGSITANTMILGTLGSTRTVAKGDYVAAVVKYGSFTGGDQVNFNTLAISGNNNLGSEYGANNLTGSYAKFNLVVPFELEYDDGTRIFSPGTAYPWSALGSDVYNNTLTPDEVGLQFQVPMPCRLGGVFLFAAIAGDCNINLYTSASKTTLRSLDKDFNNGGTLSYMVPTTAATLAANTTYVLSVEPTSAGNVTLRNISVRAAAVMDQMPGGQTWQYCTAKNPATTSDFTATTTKRALIGLMLDQLDDGTATGGSGGVGALIGGGLLVA